MENKYILMIHKVPKAAEEIEDLECILDLKYFKLNFQLKKNTFRKSLRLS